MSSESTCCRISRKRRYACNGCAKTRFEYCACRMIMHGADALSEKIEKFNGEELVGIWMSLDDGERRRSHG
jgi:hypothetical protein